MAPVAPEFDAAQAFMQQPRTLEGARITVQAFEQVLRDLARAGCDLTALEPASDGSRVALG